MGLFDDLKVLGSDLLSKSSVIAKDTAQKAQDATEMAKLKIDIAAREKEIQNLYAKIGKAYYEEYKDDATEFADDIEAISNKFVMIKELQSKYAMYKDAMGSKKEENAEAYEVTEDDTEEIIDVVIPSEKTVEEEKQEQ